MRLFKSIVAAAIITLVAGLAQAQSAAAPKAPPPSGPGEIIGKLVDSASQRPITGGSIAVRRAADTSFVGGALPKADGTFRVDGLLPGKYVLRVRALGFGQYARNDITIDMAKPIVDVGTIMLGTVVAKLAGQQITAEADEQILAPDRTTYSTKNMTTASGGTAIDVLRNIPQVEVDGSNKVSLRGNANVVIQINGRATPLRGDQLGSFLAQMPSNVVKTVEVAANPSAKDDPEGTAGIINIVLNQEAEIGLSGGLSAGTATTGSVNASGNVGKQQGKVTAFVSANIYRDSRNSTGTISRTNLVVPVPAFVETRLSGHQSPLSGGGNLRSEYRINQVDAITFDGYLYTGRFENTQSSFYTDLNAARDPIGAFNQFNETSSWNMSQDYDIAFRRQGKPGEPTMVVEAEYANNASTNNVDLSGVILQSNATTPKSIQTEHDLTEGEYPYWTVKTDYSRMIFGNKTKVETGAKYLDRTTSNDFTASYLNAATGQFEVSAARRTSFDYKEHIGSGYALLSRQFGKLQTQGGVRLEQASTKFSLPLTNQLFEKTYSSAYPSGVLSYSLTPTRTARMSYSRRVSRPYPGQLSPVEFRQDSRNVFRGNPNLGAEYTNAVDFSFLDARPWGSFNLNPYVRQTTNAVRNIQFIDADGVTVGTYENVAKVTTIGTSLNMNYRKGKLQVNGGGNASHYKSDASNLTQANYSTNTIQWSINTSSTVTFNKLADAQVFAFYRPATKTEGGQSIASVSISMGARYKIWGDQGNVSVRFNDPFNLQKFGYRMSNGSVIEYSERFFGARAIFVTVTRNFGQQLRLRAKSESEANPVGPPSP